MIRLRQINDETKEKFENLIFSMEREGDESIVKINGEEKFRAKGYLSFREIRENYISVFNISEAGALEIYQFEIERV